MPRYKLMLEYDGGPFRGWQRQSEGASVQAGLEAAVAAFCGEPVAGGRRRPDRRRRARAAVRSRISTSSRAVSPETLRNALNHHLRPHPVVVLEAARGRPTTSTPGSRRPCAHYRYRIVNRRAPLTLERGRAWHVPAPSRRRNHARGRASAWSAGTISRVSAARSARPSRRSRPWTGWRSVRRRRAYRDRGAAPARSCITRCATWSARSSWSARAASRSRDRGGAGGARPRGGRPDRARLRPVPGPGRLLSGLTQTDRSPMLIADVEDQIDQHQQQRDAAGGLERRADHEPLIDQDGAGRSA